jgi:hypothetical protein
MYRGIFYANMGFNGFFSDEANSYKLSLDDFLILDNDLMVIGTKRDVLESCLSSGEFFEKEKERYGLT